MVNSNTSISGGRVHPKLNSGQWDALAYAAVLALLAEEHAAVWPEIEAKLAERAHPSFPPGIGHIDPHHLQNARHRLLQEGRIEQIFGPTRGGGTVGVFAPTERRGRKTAFEQAAGRKRLLQARYLGWARASARGPNMIGAAGERVAHASLLRAAQAGVGYRLLNPHPEGGQVAQVLGQAVPIGPVDDAAYLVADGPAGTIIPVTVLIEVKNLRHWIYSSSAEVFQLLEKAARLQRARPEQAFVPVLVCRRAHFTAFQMARDLGFLILYTIQQPILPHSEVPAALLAEVRDELGYDLAQSLDPHPFLADAFARTLPQGAARIAERWRVTAPPLADLFAQLRDGSRPPPERAEVMDALREAARQLPGVGTKW